MWIRRLAAWFLQHLYTTLAWAYDGVAALVSLGHWQEWVLSVRPLLPGPRVLELGHGPGHLLRALRPAVWAVGIDASWPMSRLARRRHAAARLVHARAQHLPFADHCFDQVVATFPPPFIFEAATLHEVRRVLRADGSLIVLLGARLSGRSLPAALLRRLYRLTAQEAPDADQWLLRPFRQAGLEAHLAWQDAPGARLLLLQAHPGRSPRS